ncbi:MAG: TonB-dependent receptor [Bacteroidaceae bacterium]|nr:TonB-dependent receptor [Bacteroidaceae bacterium]
MNRLFFIFSLFSLFTFSPFTTAVAQKVTLSGVVMDGAMNEPLPGAAVVLLQPKDSSLVAGVSSDVEGKFKLPSLKAGNYIFRISYIGFQTHTRNLSLTKKTKDVNLGTITLQENSKLLKEAEVTARLAQVEMKADTFVYNAEAYRMPEGSMLEELVKKLPGAEIDDEGNIKINGKSVSKIMVDGKEYFQNDTKMAMKNLPSKLIKKLKAYDKKSDYTRITGIDDGEEETVLDLSVKKGMKEGWVGNFDGAYGTEDRYSGKVNVNRFLDHSYLSVIGSRNNVNDFSGRWGGGGNGITTSTMGGVTFAWENGKPDYSAGLLKLGGNVRYNSSDSESESRTNSEMFLPSGASQFSNSKNQGTSWNQNVNANFQIEWFPDSMTNIMFRPNFSHSNGDSFSDSRSVTFNESPFENGLTDPVEEYKTMDDSKGIRVNGNERVNSGNNYNNNVNGRFQINRRLVVPGRNLTFNLDGSYSESNSESYSRSMITYYQRRDINADYQNTMSPSKNYSVQGRVSYTEPILKGTVVQLSYQAQYRFQDNKRKIDIYEELEDSLRKYLPYDYNYVTATNLFDGTYRGRYFTDYGVDLTDLIEDKENSQYAKYKEFNQNVNLMLRYNNKMENGQELFFNLGVNWQPQRTEMDYRKRDVDTSVVRHIQNWAPRFNMRWKISNTSQLRVRYFGSMSQPSMTNLIEVMDNSNPLYISTGNAGLKSSWNDRFNLDYNDYITEKQMGWNFNGWANINRRSISNATIYDTRSGISYSRPMNINGNWNAGAWMGFNTALDKGKHINLNWNQNINHSNSVGYISSELQTPSGSSLGEESSSQVSPLRGDIEGSLSDLFNYMEQNGLLKKSTTRSTNLGENLRINYRNDLIEVGVNGGMNYQHARNDMQEKGNRDTWFFNYGGNVVINLPWNMQFSSDISQQSRRGYDDASMNTNELIWNAQISQNFLKQKNATLSIQWYDILRQRSSISRNYSATNRSDTWTNAIHSYVMVHLIYRFNLIGNKEARAAGFNGGQGGQGGGRGGWGGGGGGWGGRGGGGRF